jgi:hypothetical protein
MESPDFQKEIPELSPNPQINDFTFSFKEKAECHPQNASNFTFCEPEKREEGKSESLQLFNPILPALSPLSLTSDEKATSPRKENLHKINEFDELNECNEENQLHEQADHSELKTQSKNSKSFNEDGKCKSSVAFSIDKNDKPIRILRMLPTKKLQRFEHFKFKWLFSLLVKKEREEQRIMFKKWQINGLRMYLGFKISNAANMVDKMSKFSRTFISLNSLNYLFNTKFSKLLSNKFSIWKASVKSLSSNTLSSQSHLNTKDWSLRKVLLRKEQSEKAFLLRSFLHFQKQGCLFAQSEELKKKEEQFMASQKTISSEEAEESKYKEEVVKLEDDLKVKNRQIVELKNVIKQYGYWETQIEALELKMKTENLSLSENNKSLLSENRRIQGVIVEKEALIQSLIKETQNLKTKIDKNKNLPPVEGIISLYSQNKYYF